MRTIFSWFVKSELLENAETGFQLTKIDVCKRDNHVSIKSVNIGFAAQQFLQEKLKKDIVTDSDVLAFKKNCILFLSEMVAKIIERSPLKSSFVRCTSFLVPQKMVLNKDLVKLRFKKLLQKLLDLKQVTSKQCDNAQAQLLEFMDSVKVNQAEFESYDRKLCRLDEFYFSKIGVEKFPDFCLVIKLVLALSHGQASVGRGFSVNENLMVENLKESSLIARRIIYDHMKSKEPNPETTDITKHLVVGVRSAKQKYTAHLEEKKKTKKLCDKEKIQKDLQDDIDEVFAEEKSSWKDV